MELQNYDDGTFHHDIPSCSCAPTSEDQKYIRISFAYYTKEQLQAIVTKLGNYIKLLMQEQWYVDYTTSFMAYIICMVQPYIYFFYFATTKYNLFIMWPNIASYIFIQHMMMINHGYTVCIHAPIMCLMCLVHIYKVYNLTGSIIPSFTFKM